MTTPNSGTALATRPGSQPANQSGQAAPPAMPAYPFPVGVYDSKTVDYDQTKAQTAAAQQMPIYNISPTGWIRGVWFQIEMAVTGNVTNNVTFAKDNPFSVIQKMIFYDLGGREVIGPIGGYDWMTLNKFGAYQAVGDPRADQMFQATVGTGGTGGSFTFMLYLPLEIVARDALGAVQNESKPGWKVELWIDSQANTYNQVPSTLGNVRIRAMPDSYTEPEAAAPNGREFSQTPPRPGTLQYWRSENIALPSGAANYDLTNGIGFPIRNIIYKSQRTSGTLDRANGDADFPDPATLTYGNVTLFNRTKTQWINEVGRAYGFVGVPGQTVAGLSGTGTTGAATDGPLSREAGVFVAYFTKDADNSPGAELRYRYLQTMVNTVLRLSGSWAQANTLFALTNWIKPADGNYYSLLPG